jgi:hypothetical protein
LRVRPKVVNELVNLSHFRSFIGVSERCAYVVNVFLVLFVLELLFGSSVLHLHPGCRVMAVETVEPVKTV